MSGFLLGLSSGSTCIVHCLPVLLPYLLGEGRPTAQNWVLLGQFLAGRLLGYLLFGLLAWVTGSLVLGHVGNRVLLFGLVYVLLAGLLLVHALVQRPAPCAAAPAGVSAWLRRWPALLPAGLGLLTGLNLCPPFLLAFAAAADYPTLLQSVLFFAAFFAGTSLYFLPIPFLGALRRFPVLRTVGRFTAVIVATYYLLHGVNLIVGSLRP